MKHDDVAIAVERELWNTFAFTRWGLRSERGKALRHLFERRCDAAFVRLAAQARRAGRVLDFTPARVRVLVVEALDRSCCYCNATFGVGEFAVVWDVPPAQGRAFAFQLTNVVACCTGCGCAKGLMSGAVYLDVLAALRGSDELGATAAVAALRRGWQDGFKVLPHPRRPRVTREGRVRASNVPKT